LKEIYDEKEILLRESSNLHESKLKSINDLREGDKNTSRSEHMRDKHYLKDNTDGRIQSVNNLREERQELSDLNMLENEIQRADPHAKEADIRVMEGFKKPEDGASRSEFGRQYGQFEHERWEEQVSKNELKNGLRRGVDFDIEKEFVHPDGDKVRLDYVNYNTDVIVDRKPISESDTEENIKNKYKEQRTQHKEAYEHETGRKALYFYSFYPSTADLWEIEQNAK